MIINSHSSYIQLFQRLSDPASAEMIEFNEEANTEMMQLACLLFQQ